MTGLPEWDELPTIERIGLRTSWGLLPEALGTLALQSPAAVLAAARSVTTGETVVLSLAADEFVPPLFGRPTLENEVRETERNTYEDEIGRFNPQSSSQWDGLPHVRAREFGFYNGVTDLDEARKRLGMQHWAARGIVGRGVLVDVPAHLARAGRDWDPGAGDTVEPEELAAMLDEDGVVLEEGDVLLVRIGWLADRRARAAAGEDLLDAGHRFSGLAAHDGMARLLWNSRISAIGSDNPAIESAPGDPARGSLHRKLLPALGFAIAELLDLDVLAERCAALGRTTFLFVAVPTGITGAVSSPANAVAIL